LPATLQCQKSEQEQKQRTKVPKAHSLRAHSIASFLVAN